MAKPRILFVVTQSEFGGAQRFLLNLTTGIRDDFETIVVVGPDGGGEFVRALHAVGVRCVELASLRRDPRPIADVVCVRELARIIATFSPEIVFLNSSKAGVLGTLAANVRRLAGQRFFLIYRIDWAFNDPRPMLERQAYALVERALSPSRDLIIQNDRADLESARRHHIRPRVGFKIIQNGVDVGALRFLGRREAREALGFKVQANLNAFELVVGATANYYKTKGLLYLVDAIGMLAPDINVACVLIGDGGERSALERRIRARGLADRVFLVGQVPDAYRFAAACDVFVLSSVKEGFPWAVLEAMAAARPIVATKVGAVPEMIEHGVSGRLVDPGRADQIAVALRQYLADPFSMTSFGQAAREDVMSKFTLARLLRNYRDLFASIVQGRLEEVELD